MSCPNCGGYNLEEYDCDHWQCKDCKWIMLKKGIKKRR
jgi:transcription initiation factor TFIIIB Brf1 subunit/transcription initiation factor TFIIB